MKINQELDKLIQASIWQAWIEDLAIYAIITQNNYQVSDRALGDALQLLTDRVRKLDDNQ